MGLHYKMGNLLDQKGVLVHQVNALGIMGAGLALQIKRKWPIVAEKYARWCTQADRAGQCLIVPVGNGVSVANLCGQRSVGRGLQTDYAALRAALSELSAMLWDSTIEDYAEILGVSFPDHMGSGLAGGDWKVVKPMIEQYFPHATIVTNPQAGPRY